MIRLGGSWLCRLAGCVALIAALAASVLPGGFLPKIAGPCGRELCTCEFATNATPHVKAPALRLVQSGIQNADAPGSALQLIFAGLLSPSRTIVSVPVARIDLDGIPAVVFSISNHPSDIPTPPPRA